MSGQRDSASPEVLNRVRRSLGRPKSEALVEAIPAFPEGVLRPQITLANRIEARDRFIQELEAISGCASLQTETGLEEALRQLVHQERIQRAAAWQTPGLQRLEIEVHLRRLGVEVIPPQAPYRTLATCDLGVTEVDFAIPETGTLGLFSSPEKPRQVSLLPRVHLAILTPGTIFTDLRSALQLAKGNRYLVLITGPSRTADIELKLTLGVHGPQRVVAWVIQ